MTAFDTTKGATSQTNNATDSPGADASDTDVPVGPIHDAARKGQVQLQQWTTLVHPPRMSRRMTFEPFMYIIDCGNVCMLMCVINQSVSMST